MSTIPPPQPMPSFQPRSARSARSVSFWLVAVLTAFVAIAAITVVIKDASTDSVGIIDDNPAAVFDRAPAVGAAFTLRSADGTTSTGWMAVTDDGYADTTITDEFGGTATVRSTPDGSAAWGDADWWGRRVPSQASAVADRWVQPEDKAAFPIDIARDLTPAAVAEMIRSIDEEGQVNPAVTSYQGISVIASTYLDWTLIRTDTLPSTVLLLEGPLDIDQFFHSAAAKDMDMHVVPAATTTSQEGPSSPFRSLSTVDTLAIQPAAAERSSAEVVRSNASATVSGQASVSPSQSPDAEATAIPEEAVPPPAQADLAAGQPTFRAIVDAPDCSTDTCPVMVGAVNEGTAAGEATVVLTASLGPPTQSYALGVIEPGAEKSITISRANAAPTPSPGQTTSAYVTYRAVVYSPQQHGPNEEKYRNLVGRLGTSLQPWLDDALSAVDASLKLAVIDSVDRMLDAGVNPETALRATEDASTTNPADSDYSPLPIQSKLAEYADRFQGWPAIAAHQQELFADDYSLFQAGLNTVLNELANVAEPTVTFLPRVGADGQTSAVEIISDYGTPETSKCILVTADGGQPVATAVDTAAGALSGDASPAFAERMTAGCRASVVIMSGIDGDFLSADPVSPSALADRNELGEQLRSGLENSGVCAGSGPILDQVAVHNRVGESVWTGAEICSSAVPAASQARLDVLNEMLIGTDLLDQLVARGAVTLDAGGRIDTILWRNEDEECTSNLQKPVYAPTVDDLGPSSPSRQAGRQAQGAWVYLCGEVHERSPADNAIEPWDWPTSNPDRAKQGQRARCHLIANIFGGSGTDVANLVSCFQRANNDPYMRLVEKIVQRQVLNQDIFYLVQPQYNGPNGGLSGIRIVAMGSKGLDLDVCVKNTIIGGWAFNGPC